MNKQMTGYFFEEVIIKCDIAEPVIGQCSTLDRRYWIVIKSSHAVLTDKLLFYSDINAQIWQLECVVDLSYEGIGMCNQMVTSEIRE